MAGVQTSELAPEPIVLTAPPPIDDYRYATAILDSYGRYLLVNQSFAGLHGVTPDELRGRTEADLIARTVASALAGNDRLALDAPTAILTEERVVDSVGRRRVVMCRCCLVDADRKPHAVVRMYGSASARDRVIAEFHQLLDALDPTGGRTHDFESVRLGPNAGQPAGAGARPGPGAGAPAAGAPAGGRAPASGGAPGGGGPAAATGGGTGAPAPADSSRPETAGALAASPRPDDEAVRMATEGLLAAERAARTNAEVLLAAERAARTNAEVLLAAERAARTNAETQLAGEREARIAAETGVADQLAGLAALEAQLAETRAGRAQTESELRAQRDGRAQTEATRVAHLEAALAAELRRRTEVERTAEAAITAERDGRLRAEAELVARHETLRAEHADVQARLRETIQALERERATREALAADLGSVGARSAAAETAIRAQAAGVEARLAGERRAREDAETRAREVAAEQAGERAAREQAEARARELETQRAAELKMRQHAESKTRDEDAAARKAANARAQELEAQTAVARGARHQAETHARELEARRAAEQEAREQAEARAAELATRHAADLVRLEDAVSRLRDLEADHAGERRAREIAEAHTLQLEAERLAARAALDSIRRRLDPSAPDHPAAEAADHTITPPPPASRIAFPAEHAPVRLTPRAVGDPAAPTPRRPAGPMRRRAPTIHRELAELPEATFPALTSLLGRGRNSSPAKSLRAVLPSALSVIGDSSSWDAVAIWQEAQSGRPLTCLGIWTRPAHELDWFESITWHAKLELGEPPSADVDEAGRLTWVPDLGTDGEADVSARERTARSADLASRVVVPLSSPRKVVGALEVLARDVRQLDDVSVARLASAARALTPLLLRDIRDANERRWRV